MGLMKEKRSQHTKSVHSCNENIIQRYVLTKMVESLELKSTQNCFPSCSFLTNNWSDLSHKSLSIRLIKVNPNTI